MPIPKALDELWPALAILAALLIAIETILRKTNWLSFFEAPMRSRLASLDGLRAFLAYGVVVCHVGTFYYVYRGAPWGPHPNPYYHQAGAASVRIFFMITGYLFWYKAISKEGRLPAWDLYRNRLLRIMPLYALLVGFLVVLSFVYSGLRFVEPPLKVVSEVAELAIPGIVTEGKINGFDYTEFIRQAWTLKWEVIFYALLPLIAVFARSLKTFLVLAVILVIATAVVHRKWEAFPDLSVTLNFLVGMSAAHLKKTYPDWKSSRHPGVSAAVLLVAIGAPYVIERVSPYLGNLLYAALFIAVLYGNDAFGLLSARSSRVLGEISYSVYLLHMVVLVLFYRYAHMRWNLGTFSHEAFWLLSIAPIVAIVVLSFLTFRWVESPGIALSHRKRQTS